MNKLIVEKVKTGFAQISIDILQDKDLSLKAKGMMSVILSLSDDWQFSIKGLISIVKEGKTAVYAVINELIEAGYCKRQPVINEETNLINGYDYMFSWSRKWEEIEPRDTDSRNPDFREAEKSDANIYKKNIYKTNKPSNSLPYENLDFVDIPELLPAFTTWLKYKQARKENYKNEDSLKAAYKKLVRFSGGNGKIADEIIEDAMGNNSQGFFAPRNNFNGQRNSPKDIQAQLREDAKYVNNKYEY